jgi:CRP-like cAMP-binding protein
LIQQGQVGKEIYFLEEGSVKVYRGKADSSKALAVIQAPAVLGEMALSDPERIQTSSASALSDLKLLSIPMETLLVLTGVYPSVKKKLREAIASGHGS